MDYPKFNGTKEHSISLSLSLILLPILLHLREMVLANLIYEPFDQIMESKHRSNGHMLPQSPLSNTQSALAFRVADPLLPIKENDNTNHSTACALNDAHRLTQCCPR